MYLPHRLRGAVKLFRQTKRNLSLLFYVWCEIRVLLIVSSSCTFLLTTVVEEHRELRSAVTSFPSRRSSPLH